MKYLPERGINLYNFKITRRFLIFTTSSINSIQIPPFFTLPNQKVCKNTLDVYAYIIHSHTNQEDETVSQPKRQSKQTVSYYSLDGDILDERVSNYTQNAIKGTGVFFSPGTSAKCALFHTIPISNKFSLSTRHPVNKFSRG